MPVDQNLRSIIARMGILIYLDVTFKLFVSILPLSIWFERYRRRLDDMYARLEAYQNQFRVILNICMFHQRPGPTSNHPSQHRFGFLPHLILSNPALLLPVSLFPVPLLPVPLLPVPLLPVSLPVSLLPVPSPYHASILFNRIKISLLSIQCSLPVNFSFRHHLNPLLPYLLSAGGSPSSNYLNPVNFASTYRWSPVFLEMEQRRFTYFHFRLSHPILSRFAFLADAC
ncbi:hypothetical protein BJV77DRAFT_1017174 [Russula vinacea]|nr:hypothetical protein BJV77DRAFT_1017174 [Russula vinacea]